MMICDQCKFLYGCPSTKHFSIVNFDPICICKVHYTIDQKGKVIRRYFCGLECMKNYEKDKSKS